MGNLIGGLKLTHDGGVAVIEGDRLLFSVEAEKLANQGRYSLLDQSAIIVEILTRHGVKPDDLSGLAVDGWVTGDAENRVTVVDGAGRRVAVEVAGYGDPEGPVDLADSTRSSAPLFGGAPVPFRSYTHATDHAMAAYCTSPFAVTGRAAVALVWDGGTVPCVYRVDPAVGAVTMLSLLMPYSGGLYPIFASHLSPFRLRTEQVLGGRSAIDQLLLPISGKAMAYTALAGPAEEAIEVMRAVSAEVQPVDIVKSYRWSRTVLRRLASAGLSEAAVLASFQEYLGRRLVESLRSTVAARPDLGGLPICLSGGCALNIKWNARIRSSGIFPEVWVPPFPNDAGSAIGAAAAEMVRQTGNYRLDWSVFAGPEVLPVGDLPIGWTARPCTVEELAGVLDEVGEPVVVLSGRAEAGPRALGHRSIIAPATTPAMRDVLNEVKDRESYRPVAPMCLEERAAEVFSPGVRDPYMLYEHQVRPEWKDRIPAVIHIDGSARLQTVGPDHPTIHRLLSEYERRTGVPVLCNTSANFSGSGFFPDVASAIRWGRLRHVWSDDILYARAG
jgi:carbamoyltransferase